MIASADIDDFRIAVSATVLDAKKLYVTFEDQKLPAGAYADESWSVEQRDNTGAENVYLLKNNRPSADDKFVTPLLKVREGEALTFDACRVSTWSYGDEYYLNVYYSADRKHWTLARKITSQEMSSESGSSSYNYSYGKLTSFTVDNIPAGNFYIAFGAGSTCIDNIYGFEPVEVKHDIVCKEAQMPATAMVNYPYKATATFTNLNSKDEEEGSYRASLYIDGEVAATAQADAIGAGADATFTFSYTPHTAGQHQAYVLYENEADAVVVSSDTVAVSVEAEALKSAVTVGSGSVKNANVFVYWYNVDNSNGIDDDVVYPASMLAKYGLAKGSKIKALTYRGSASSNCTMANTTLEARVAMVDEATFTPCENYEDIPVIKVYDNEPVSVSSSQPFVTTITLPEPLVWDGVSALRVFTHAKSDSYASIYYTCDDEVKQSYYYMYSVSYPNNNPIVAIDVEAEPAHVAGTIYGDGKALAGATVTLRNADNDVVYTAQSADDGAFKVDVLQKDKAYTLTVTADGYAGYEADEALSFDSESDLTLSPITLQALSCAVDIPESGLVAFSADRPVSFAVEGMKAYVVTGVVEKNDAAYTELAEIEQAPAHTGVLLVAAPGRYTLPCLDEARSVEHNLLVATDDAAYTVPADEAGTIWTLATEAAPLFNAATADAVVPQGTAFLRHSISVPGIYLYADDVPAASGIGHAFTAPGAQAPMYDMGGRRVPKEYKGIVIQNGKKRLKR